ncbi:MAG TPA: 23S rRNA (adenine(2503)-C(2))-methyltransferase RlmN [Nitrospiraceae bacterium]|nr:23S rRNA (adenine(2503)-C(2))-methyltransferase RlmN [Nitrospiraceae bacterium]
MVQSSPVLVPQTPLPNLLAFSHAAVETLVRDVGWPRHRTRQILRWLYKKRTRTIQDMTDLSHAERAALASLADIRRLRCERLVESTDGTMKLLARLEDGLLIECVLIPDGRRLTLCVSTQVGCTLDCRFCLTATMGLKRNLRAHEIVDQVLMAQDHLAPHETLTSLVLMGMGEPLANLDAVKEALARLTDSTWGVGIPARRITLSTAGFAGRLNEVADLGINLAVSLNATTPAQREHLMPTINRLFSLDELLEACRQYPLPPHRRLTFEYVLLAGVNDSDQDAKRLIKLLTGLRCKVNLIPFNEFAGSAFTRPDDGVVLRFQSRLKQAGVPTFIRKSKGRDVLGACGQLGCLPHETADALTPIGVGC